MTDPVLDAAQLTDFRADIADVNLAFSDPELQRLYVRAKGSYELAVALAFEQLMSNAAKFAEYTQNQSRENRKQIFDNLEKMANRWLAKAEQVSKKGKQIRLVRIRQMPKPQREAPRRTLEDGD